MLKSKAIDIIKTFTEDELKRFGDFVSSPYFNSSKSLIKLLSSLKTFYPDFSSQKMNEEFVYGKVYGKGKYSYSAMRNLMSDLLNLCEKFVLNERLNKNPAEDPRNLISLLEEYRFRKLDNLFNIKAKRLEEELSKFVISNEECFNVQSKYEILKYQFHLNQHSHNKIVWQGFINKSTYELCAMMHVLYITCNTIIQSSEELGGNPAESPMIQFLDNLDLDNFLKHFSLPDSKAKYYLYTYSKLILLDLNEKKDISETYYFEIKNSFIKNYKYFPSQNVYDILKTLRSYAITRMRMKKKHFIDELFEIDKYLIEKVDYSFKRISWYVAEIFSEIVVLAVHKKDFKFAEDFIDNNIKNVSKEIRDFEYGWNKALLSIESKQYNKALEYLSKIKPVNINRKIAVKILYLRAFYELGYFEEGFLNLDALKHTINKDENLAPERKKHFHLLQNILYRLYKIRVTPERYGLFDLKKLEEDVDSFYFLTGIDWYHEKITDLRKLIKN